MLAELCHGLDEPYDICVRSTRSNPAGRTPKLGPFPRGYRPHPRVFPYPPYFTIWSVP